MARNARYPGQDMVSLTLRLPLAAKHKLYEDSGGRPVPHLVKLIEGGGQPAAPAPVENEFAWMNKETSDYIKFLTRVATPERANLVLKEAARLELIRLEDEEKEAKRNGRA